jgi:hypothetical protein
MFRRAIIAGLILTSVAPVADADDDLVLVEDPSLSERGRASCYFFEERPAWYRIENSRLVVDVTYPPEVQGAELGALRLLTFQVEFKDRELKTKAGFKPLTFGNPEMGPLGAMLLTEDKFVVTGCSSSHRDFVYIADIGHPDRGTGISCRDPRLSPNGKFVVFDSAFGRMDTNSCTFVLSLGDESFTPYRVYPCGQEFAQPEELDEVGWIDNWYRAGLNKADSCSRANGWGRHRFSVTAWNPAGSRIAFIDTSKPPPQYDELGNRVYDEPVQVEYHFVVIDISKGLPSTRAISLVIDEAAFQEDSQEYPKFDLHRSTIRWKDDMTVVVDVHSTDPPRRPPPHYELKVTEDLLNRTEWPPFLEAAQKFAGEPVAAPTPDPDPPCP